MTSVSGQDDDRVVGEDAAQTSVHQLLGRLADGAFLPAITMRTRVGVVRWAYADLLNRTWREARRLEAYGVGIGSVVAVATRHDPVALTLRWATNVLGATVVMVPDGYSARGLAEIFEVTRPDVVLTDSARRSVTTEAAAMASVRLVTDIDGDPLPADSSPLPIRARRGDMAAMQLTTGTTGSPKAVPRWFTPPVPQSVLDGWSDAVQLLWTPLAHVGGAVAMLVLRAGGRVVMLPEFDPRDVVEAIEQERVTTIMPLFPRHLARLLDEPALADADTTSLRDLRLGGAATPPARIGEAIGRFGRIVGQVYGTIEATNIATLSAEELARPELRGTVGRPSPGVELSMRAPEGAECPVGEVGQVWVRSAAVMRGYVNAPEETASVLSDGWLATGDLGRLDEDGYLTLVGRLKDLIYAEHARIYPPDIEAVLAEHPDVESAAVFGVSDADGVESAAAAVILRTGRAATADDLRAWVKERRGRRYVPAAVHLVARLPTVAGSKVDRRALRERFAGARPTPRGPGATPPPWMT